MITLNASIVLINNILVKKKKHFLHEQCWVERMWFEFLSRFSTKNAVHRHWGRKKNRKREEIAELRRLKMHFNATNLRVSGARFNDT